ncbi:hypothetical protein [Cohnella hongkongensis]|uniref:Uncharacterized protein n=1 Tax=Cohnella hongkongensis TaxID=178337 RepID=A0ABV9FG02_9BACL
MKIGAFVIGGLAGMALVMWLQRNPNLSMAAVSMGSNVKDRMRDLKDEAVEKAMNSKLANGLRRVGAENREEQSSPHSRSVGDSGKDQIRKLISQDPEVGKAVNDILEQNGHPHN